MEKIKVATLYDQGSSPYREDGLFANYPFFGVLDGVSAPFNSQHPPKMFCGGLTGGEIVVRAIENIFTTCGPSANLRELIVEASRQVYVLQWKGHDDINDIGLDSSDPGDLAGATFAIAKVDNNVVRIAQTGDGFALWTLRNGGIRITKNQVHGHDTRMNDTILSLQREIAKEMFTIELEEATPEQSSVIRKEMWIKFYPILKDARREDVNNLSSQCGYGLLNGQKDLESMVFKKTIDRDEIETLILFTDGMVPWQAMKDLSNREIAKRVYEIFQQGGLPKMLNVARGIEESIKSINYTDSAEATAIALSF